MAFIHADIIECDCLEVRRPGCMFVECKIPLIGDVQEACCGEDEEPTRMHPHCWDMYGKRWNALHPLTNRQIADAGIEAAERRVGA